MRRELTSEEVPVQGADSVFPYSLDNSPTIKGQTAQPRPAPRGLTKLQQRLLYEGDSDSSFDVTFSSPSSTGSTPDYSDIGSASSSRSSRPSYAAHLRQLSSASSLSPGSPLGSSVAIQRVLMGSEPSSRSRPSQRHSVRAIASAFEQVSHNDQPRRPSAPLPQSTLRSHSLASAMPTASESRSSTPVSKTSSTSRYRRSEKRIPESLNRGSMRNTEPIPWQRVDFGNTEPDFAMVPSPRQRRSRIPAAPLPSLHDRELALLQARRGSANSVYSNDSLNDEPFSFRSDEDLDPNMTIDTSLSTLLPSDIDLNSTPRPRYPQLSPAYPKSADFIRSRKQASVDESALKREAQDLLASIRALTSEIDGSTNLNKDASDSFSVVEKSYAQVWGVMDAWHWSTWHMASSKPLT